MLFCDTSQGSKFSNAGVSENDVDLPLYPTDGVVETIQVGQFGNVSLNARNVAADCPHGLIKLLLPTAHDEDIGTLSDEELCRSQPYPRRAAGDDRHFALQFAHGSSSPSLLFLLPPLRVKLRDRRTDGKSPGKNREILELLWHDVAVLGFFHRHPRTEHLVRLRGDVVKDFAHRGDAALPAQLPMPWHEQRILVPRREGLQRLAPPGNHRLLVEADGIQPAKQ